MPPIDKKTARLLRRFGRSAQDDIETSTALIRSLELGIIGMNGFIQELQAAGRAHTELIRKLERDMAAKEALIAKIPKSVGLPKKAKRRRGKCKAAAK